ncbi:MAG: CpaF family protein, partial [Candidatus Hydrothermarchaeota archaeon]
MVDLNSLLSEEKSKKEIEEDVVGALADKNREKFLSFLNRIEKKELARFFLDDDVEEIMIIGDGKPVYIFKNGRMEETKVILTEEEIVRMIHEIAAFNGREVNEENPILEARLPNGDRVEALLSTVSPKGSNITIRRFKRKSLCMLDLINFGSLDSLTAAYLWLCVEGLKIKPANILVIGGTATGKTTFLNALTHFIEKERRIVTIEDVHELVLMHDHHISLETSVSPGCEITLDDLLKASLRMRPDRIIIGEVRGIEARTLFTAMNTGHDGCMGTLHANSARDAFDRLTNPPMEVPLIMLKALDMVVSL